MNFKEVKTLTEATIIPKPFSKSDRSTYNSAEDFNDGSPLIAEVGDWTLICHKYGIEANKSTDKYEEYWHYDIDIAHQWVGEALVKGIDPRMVTSGNLRGLGFKKSM